MKARHLLLLLALSACDKSPSEPPPATSTSRPMKTARCVRQTPEVAPPRAAPGPDPRCPKDPASPPATPMGKIRFPEATNAPTVDVELMLTDPHRERGLMYRREMAETHGMLFVFDEVKEHGFWMHNTCLPLDMLFVAEDGFVVGLLEEVPTMNDDMRSVPCRSKYVLELNAGFARKFGVKAGQTIQIDGAPKP